MPLLANSAYHPSLLFRNGHIQTIFPALLRKIPPTTFVRERIATADDDFIDLDWLCHPAKAERQTGATASKPPLAILTHGLEGNSGQPYMLGMARALFAQGWDVLAWNFRGCSGTTNLQLRSYHSGATDDLAAVIAHATRQASQLQSKHTAPATTGTRFTPLASHTTLHHAGTQRATAAPTEAHPVGTTPAASNIQPAPTPYTRIALVGFSLGGNIVLKYLGETTAVTENTTPIPASPTVGRPTGVRSTVGRLTQSEQGQIPQIIGAVAISVPCDLSGSTTVLERRSNRIYMERFLKTLRQKIREKHRQFPGQINIDGLDAIRTFRQFDDRYTAPLHGFDDADHYWHTCSCLRVIERIDVPALLLNAADDPFLSADCFPANIAKAHPFFHLETPSHGGHVGFVSQRAGGLYYSEQRACEFLNAAAAR